MNRDVETPETFQQVAAFLPPALAHLTEKFEKMKRKRRKVIKPKGGDQ